MDEQSQYWKYVKFFKSIYRFVAFPVKSLVNFDNLTHVIWQRCGSAGKESACNVGDLVSIPGLGGSPAEGKGYPLQYSGLENSTDCIVLAVAESDTTERLSFPLGFPGG